MASSEKKPRVVLVTRRTEYEELVARHATHHQVHFFLETRGRKIEEVVERHHRFESALDAALAAVPGDWRHTRVDRADLDRFLFEPDDVVVAVGQDGLVANAAKYLDGQPVVGLNPDAELFEGVLVPHPPAAARDLLAAVVAGRAEIEERTMVSARLDDGQELVALNEVFIGHRTHQSARYRIALGGHAERQSSSGLIVATGTGATGWARSIHLSRHSALELPSPEERRLAFFVREAWPSVSTFADLVEGSLAVDDELEIVSEMGDDGVVFGDGIEADRIEFGWGRSVRVRVAGTKLRLVR